MVLKGVEEIDWFTDRPFRSEGLWKPQKLISQWDSFFATSEPNAQASLKVGEERELITFEMFKPNYNKGNQRLAFDIDAEIINKREADLVTGLKGKYLNEVSLFIDDATTGAPTLLEKCLANDYRKVVVKDLEAGSAGLQWANLAEAELPSAYLYGAQLYGANLTDADLTNATLTNANLSSANLSKANLTKARMWYANLAKTTQSHTTRSRESLRPASLANATLTGAELQWARLIGTDLTGADLTDANLSNADLSGAIWNNTTCPDGTKNIGTSPCTTEQLNLA